MRWMPLPQSLFARLLLTLLAAIGTAVLIMIFLIARERRDLVLLGSGGWSAARSIAEISAQLADLDPTQRAITIEQLQAETIVLEDPNPRPAVTRQQQYFEQIAKALERRLRRELRSNFEVHVRRSPRAPGEAIQLETEGTRLRAPLRRDGPRGGGPLFRTFDVSVRLPDGQEVRFNTSAPRPGDAPPSRIFVDIAALVLGLAAVLYLMTRTITRPLSDLARAADAIGRGQPHAPIPERGAKELRDATRAFNVMQERLHRYLDSRTRILSAMSHDLRTPLTRLRLRAETIDDEATRERFIADLDEMSDMVRGALDMFKGTADTEPVEAIDVNQLLATLQREFDELGGPVRVTGQTLGPIQGRPLALKRCISNLLHNAVKYGERADVEIRDGRELSIHIRDHGPGIPEPEIEQVFQPFYRIDTSRSRDTGGSGLGLSIARDIAQAHGGSIALSNHPQGGLEAVLRLPR